MRVNEVVTEDENNAPEFVFIIGGAGSGKNYFINHHPVYRGYRLIDVDVIKQSVDLSTAIGLITPMLEEAFKKKLNVVHPGTGANLPASKNKIALARKHGYRVTLLLIDTDLETAAGNVQKRAAAGGHDVNIDVIANSNNKAKNNFSQLTDLVDSFAVIKR